MKKARYFLVLALIFGAFAAASPTQAACGGANCWIQYQEANDPGYGARYSSNYYSDSSSYQPSYTSNSSSYYNDYPNNDRVIETFRRGDCRYTVRRSGGTEYTTRTCSN